MYAPILLTYFWQSRWHGVDWFLIVVGWFPHVIFFTSDICEALHVTGDTSNSEGGLYLPSDERASDAPNNPVWKNSAGNRFIFNTGSSRGWRIGTKSFLSDGDYYCKGKHILILSPIASTYIWILNIHVHKSSLGNSSSLPITSEEWTAIGGTELNSEGFFFCGSSGAVQVKCAKFKGKPFEKIIHSKYLTTDNQRQARETWWHFLI